MAHRDRLAFDVALGPELEAGIAEQRAEVDAIAAGPWPPGFDDTVAALERSGGRLSLARRLLEDAAATRSTPAVRALEAEWLPRLAAHDDAVGLDPLCSRGSPTSRPAATRSASTPNRPTLRNARPGPDAPG